METVKASSTWSPETGVYRLYPEPPAPSFAAEPGGTPLLAILWELHEQDRETGRVAVDQAQRGCSARQV